jgi:pimeloyl-ACP methyl ester carboxylesterase
MTFIIPNRLITRSTGDASIRRLLQGSVLLFALIASFGAMDTWASDAPAPAAAPAKTVSWKNVPTRSIAAGGIDFVYRELGQQHGGTPVVFLNHLAAVLDNWDPRVVDGIASRHHVIAFDNRGIGASTGAPASSIEQMAADAITFVKAQGHQRVDLFGFSMGGMIAQEIALKEPQLVRKMILAGTGPAGGEGISGVAGVANLDLIRAFLSGQDPKQFLFFTRTPAGISAGKDFLARLNERVEHRDKEITVAAYTAQLRALSAWGQKAPADLSVVKQPVLVVNGDNDRMVPTRNSHDLARRLPNAALAIYPDAGHGGVFQFHAQFVPLALEFLAR